MITKGGLRCCWATSAALPLRATERAPIPSPTRSFEGKPARSGGAAAPDSEAGRSESANEDVRAARGRRRTAARTNSDAIAANRDLDRVSRPQETPPPTMRRAPPRADRYRIPHDRAASSVHPHHSPILWPCPAPRCRTRATFGVHRNERRCRAALHNNSEKAPFWPSDFDLRSASHNPRRCAAWWPGKFFPPLRSSKDFSVRGLHSRGPVQVVKIGRAHV